MAYYAESYDIPHDFRISGPAIDVTILSRADPIVVWQMLNRLGGVDIDDLVPASAGEVTAPEHTLSIRMGRDAVTRVIQFDQE